MSIMAEKKEKRYVSDNAQLMAEWDFEKNHELGLDPHNVTCGSGIKAWWKCSRGHEWQAIIAHRNKGSGCPFCAGKRVIKGHNDLQTLNPAVAQEWNFEKNIDITPVDVLPNSNKTVWWKCRKGHEWQAVIANRNKGVGCPVCFSERNTSFPEYALLFYLQRYGLDAIHSYKEQGYELDIYIPSKKVAIEYDGYYWHKNKIGKDVEKNLRCERDGIKLYRIREALPSLNSSSIDLFVQKNQQDLPEAIAKILMDITGIVVDIDILRDMVAIESLREHLDKEESLLFANPEIASEWNYEKNGALRPEDFLANSQKNVWWKCDKGHEWRAKILNRNHGYGCPYCSGRLAIKGVNDLQTVNPDLAKEWHYEKNNSLTPMDVLPSSDVKAWWKCDQGHEWQTQIKVRSKGAGCPYCSGRVAITGQNDLKTVNPTLAEEWNYERNGNSLPGNFLPNSGKKVWWKCSKGHEWEQTIDKRTNGVGCPYCSGLHVVKGQNDLQTVNPDLAREWHHEKNGNLTPMDVLPHSDKKVWWKCDEGHEWETQVKNRTRGTGCPYCAGRQVLKGYNDLATVNPALAADWNYEKNGDLTPDRCTANSKIKIWWKCNHGHEWQATIANRNYGTGCPICSNKRILIGYNDLSTVNPTVANEWNHEKNGTLKPESFAPNSGRKVWWICSKGHEWQARIAERNKGLGCPYCSSHRVLRGYNDLQTMNPDLAQEWNYDKNDGLMPTDVMPNSNRKVWWKCRNCGNEWEAMICNRNKGNGCSQCAREKCKAVK